MAKEHTIICGVTVGEIHKPIGRTMVLQPNETSLPIEGICEGVIKTPNQRHFIIGGASIGEGTLVKKISTKIPQKNT
jgi:hypothetical protein